jgi:lipopolysaccharide export system permease protein
MSKRVVTRTAFSLVFWGLLEPFLLVIAAFTMVHLLADAADQFNDIAANSAALAGIEYLVLRIPYAVTKLLPVSLLAGVMFGFALLNRNGEVVAMQALGISRVQIALPLILIAIVATGFDFVVSEQVVPVTNRRAKEVLVTRIQRGQRQATSMGETWVRTRYAFVVAEDYDRVRREMIDVTIFRFDHGEQLRAIEQADSAHWSGQGWHFQNVRSFQLGAGPAMPAPKGTDQTLDLSPDDLATPISVNPDDFSLAELNGFIAALERVGLNPQNYLADRDLKYAMPFSCLVLAAIGFALSLDPLPRNQGFARSIGFALAAGFGYWLILGFTLSFGRSGVMPAWAGAWLPNILLGSIAVSMFLMGEEK